MTSTPSLRKNRLDLSSDRLLLVEGQDEVNFFEAFLLKGFSEDQNSRLQVMQVGGKDAFRHNLFAIVGSIKKEEIKLKTLGVVRDADDNPASSLESVQNSLKKSGFCFPKAHAEFCGKDPSVGIFILPDGRSEGVLETLCRKSVKGKLRTSCVERAISNVLTNTVRLKPSRTVATKRLSMLTWRQAQTRLCGSERGRKAVAGIFATTRFLRWQSSWSA